MRAVVFSFLTLVLCALAKDSGFLPTLDEKFQEILSEYVRYVANWFQSFNDAHLGNTEIGKLLNYDEMKRKLMETENHIAESRSMKKHGASMMPLVFHMGAASTWMLLTTLLAAKSLAVGLALLVFKLAAGSAKLASFFTQLKHSKDHSEWGSAWSPHYEHDNHIEHSPKQQGTTHHNPPWTPKDISQHFNDYKNNQFHDSQNEFHDLQNEFRGSQNNEFHNYNKHEYKTITEHDVQDSDGFQGDYNYLEGGNLTLKILNHLQDLIGRNKIRRRFRRSVFHAYM